MRLTYYKEDEAWVAQLATCRGGVLLIDPKWWRPLLQFPGALFQFLRAIYGR